MAAIEKTDPAYAGQKLIALYDAHASGRHLDIGVGTGRLLDECRFPAAAPQITLMDLNPNSLAVAAGRLERYAPRTHRASVLGEGAAHTWLARRALAGANRRGFMCNLEDTLEDLDAALDRVFASHEIEVVGSAALFHAS